MHFQAATKTGPRRLQIKPLYVKNLPGAVCGHLLRQKINHPTGLFKQSFQHEAPPQPFIEILLRRAMAMPPCSLAFLAFALYHEPVRIKRLFRTGDFPDDQLVFLIENLYKRPLRM